MLFTNKFYIQVYLCEEREINPVFTKANSYILAKFKENFDSLTTDSEKLCLLKRLWIQEFKANLVEEKCGDDNIDIAKIQFDSQETMTMFLLRWG